jgi:hypothetical protein
MILFSAKNIKTILRVDSHGDNILKEICASCLGSGFEGGIGPGECTVCNGSGFLLNTNRLLQRKVDPILIAVLGTSLIVALLMASQAKFRFLLFIIAVYMWGGLTYIILKIAHIPSGISRAIRH